MIVGLGFLKASALEPEGEESPTEGTNIADYQPYTS